MAAAAVLPALVSVEEYLRTSYDPDVDYVDGFIEERNVGEIDHAWLQRVVLMAIARQEKAGGFFAIQEVRVQVAEGRFRVPDICVVSAEDFPTRYVTVAPLLCIEVLSPEDTYSRTQVKCRDYLVMGVPEVWIFDLEQKNLQIMRADVITTLDQGTVKLPEFLLKSICPKHSPGRAPKDMTIIQQSDLIESVRAALQYISFYHPIDYIENLARAYELEQSPAAKDAIKQILVNSRMCAEGHRPICQDTGIVTVFIKLGLECHLLDGTAPATLSLQEMCDEGVRRAWLDPDNKLRGSILADPAFARKNTKDNTPCVVEVSLVKGNTVDVTVAAKGGGSEAKSKFVMLNPSDSVVDWVIKTIPTMGAGWCPPGMIGIGLGGTAEKAMLLAKQSLMGDIDMQELKAAAAAGHPLTSIEKLRIELYDKINALGIGAQGLGGLTTVLDVKILDWPTHAANLPVAMIPNCAATRHAHFVMDGSGPVYLDPPSLEHWPKLTYEPHAATRVDLATVTREDVQSWKPGEVLLLNGKLLTGRDAAHKRMTDMLTRGEKLPVDFTGKFIYYVGPVEAVRDEAVGPAGPTTATRMDKFTRQMLEQTGLLGMIGKAERGVAAIDAIRDNKAVYLMAVGGAAYLVSKAIKHSRLLAFEDLGMEAIFEFDVVDMPVTIAVDSQGTSVHITGPEEWREKIAHSMAVGGIPILGQ